MPGMDGAELGRQLGSYRLGIPILYVTALAVAQSVGREMVKRIVLEPGVPILAKPFSIEALEKSARSARPLLSGISAASPSSSGTN